MDARMDMDRNSSSKQAKLAALTHQYLMDLPRQLTQIRLSWDQGDRVTVQTEAHRIKGTSATFCFDALAAQFAKLEAQALEAPAMAVVACLEQCDAMIASLIEMNTSERKGHA